MLMTQSIRAFKTGAFLFASCILAACSPPASYDVILRGGTVYDGSGGDPYVADVAIDNDTVATIGNLERVKAGGFGFLSPLELSF